MTKIKVEADITDLKSAIKEITKEARKAKQSLNKPANRRNVKNKRY